MSSAKHLTRALIAALALVPTASAYAKGPQGGGAGAMPTHSAAPNAQGIGSNTWKEPPGWDNATGSNGWDGSLTPPGWEHNTTGQTNGWNATSPAAPPGFDKPR